ncbi:MAG: hypothetical protein IJS32_01200 [Kiritimatiellae bacterium]|nr:hypothetical protein [Kiritimatiellia bacterium]
MKAVDCIGVILTDKEANQLKKDVRRQGVTVSEYIASAIRNFLPKGVQTPAGAKRKSA